MHVTRKAQRFQPIRKTWTEEMAVAHPCELVIREMEFLEVLKCLFEAGGHQEIALRRQSAHEELEYGRIVHVVHVIRVQHRKLIEVRQQGRSAQIHRSIAARQTGMGPASRTRVTSSTASAPPGRKSRWTPAISSAA